MNNAEEKRQQFVEMRKQIGTQKEVALLLGKSLSSVQKIERGARKVRNETLLALKQLIESRSFKTLLIKK